jgi:surface polysaccharide O-acyltransferase-like enzyme
MDIKIEKTNLISDFRSIFIEKEEIRKAYNQPLKRNYGIDFLKIISMINIINLHINKKTGLLNKPPENNRFKQVYRLQAFSLWPVNVFGLVSGMISFRKYKFSNLFYIWFEYFFYSTFFSIYLYKKSLLDLRNLILSFFPIGIKRLWYFNAYFFMYLLLPFVTISINSINKDLYTKLIIFYFVMHSVYHIIMDYNIRNTNFDFINKGYSSNWLTILYIAGAYIGRFYLNKPLFSKFTCMIFFFFSTFITSEYIFYSYDKYKFPNKILLQYFSPTIVIQALSLIFFFSSLDITNKYLIKILLFFNPLNFNVTLIHMRIFNSKTSIVNKFFKYIELLRPKHLFFKIYFLSTITYFLCAFFDYIRYLIFKILKIRKFCIYIENKLIKN